MSNWIKCSDALPPADRMVFVWPPLKLKCKHAVDRRGYMMGALIYGKMQYWDEEANYLDGHEYNDDGMIDSPEITYWQHFPEGPTTDTDYNSGLGESLLGFFSAVQFLANTIDTDKTSVNEIKDKLMILINNHLERVKKITDNKDAHDIASK